MRRHFAAAAAAAAAAATVALLHATHNASAFLFGCSFCSFALGYGTGLRAGSLLYTGGYYYPSYQQPGCYSSYGCGGNNYYNGNNNVIGGCAGTQYGCCPNNGNGNGNGNNGNGNNSGQLRGGRGRNRLSFQNIACVDSACSNCNTNSGNINGLLSNRVRSNPNPARLSSRRSRSRGRGRGRGAGAAKVRKKGKKGPAK